LQRDCCRAATVREQFSAARIYNCSFHPRCYRNAANITVTVGGVSVPVLYHSAAPGFAGLDQVNIGPIPISLAGQGNANIVTTSATTTGAPSRA